MVSQKFHDGQRGRLLIQYQVLDLRGPQQKHKEEPTKVPKPKK